MKNKVSFVIAAFTIGMFTVMPFAFAQNKMSGPSPKPLPKTAPSKVQKATITIDGGYVPNSIQVHAGKPVLLTFVRKSAVGCDGELVIPSLKIQRNLKQGEKTVVAFTPKKTGTIPYSCSMEMYKGRIVVVK